MVNRAFYLSSLGESMEKQLQDAITQLKHLSMELMKAHATRDPMAAHALLGKAIHQSRAEGVEPQLLAEVYQQVFPGQAIPMPRSE